MSTLLIRGGRLVDPASGVDGLRDVLLRDGLVAAVETPGAFDGVEVAETLEAKGCVVAPGLVDVHVHLREPGQTYKETIATGTAAAAAGGFTTVVAMPNTIPVTDRPSTLRWVLSSDRNPHVRLFCMPAATIGSMGTELTDFETLAAAGAVGFTDDGKPILDGVVMREALLRAARLGLVVSQHAEDTTISPSSGIHAGPAAFRLGLRGMSVEAEARMVERDIRLVRELEKAEGVWAHLHVQHISTARALKAIRSAKSDGLHVTCEAAPHHFTLTDAAVEYGGCDGDIHFDTNAKMNPPLRTEGDRLAVIAGLLDGTIDCIATDHAPHARHEKEVEFERAPNGITGLETALGLALRVLGREHGASVSRIVQLMSSGPASVVSRQQAGSLGVGQWGDVVVFDAEAEWAFSAAGSRSKSKNTPFDGATMLGRVLATVVGGNVVFRG
jgi:dihydroorotase